VIKWDKKMKILVISVLIGLVLGVHLFITGTWTPATLAKDIEIWVAEAAFLFVGGYLVTKAINKWFG
jgi:uncharacterized protein YneF (UPF0154 family)